MIEVCACHDCIVLRDSGAILLKLADVLKAHEDELALLETIDCGYPVTQSKNMHLADAIAVSLMPSHDTHDDVHGRCTATLEAGPIRSRSGKRMCDVICVYRSPEMII